ncbi:hypothetical protein H0H81_000818 [Sphagnurus paluster]|uniref:EH domain-containing protein n=1 Tax=Sphagnurus paluster TaxID=117069 RepID=A0A9P7K5Z9_9AGAR|nr:hypothetical protein H0H81_000818 [Sphagnurus paluster]
MTARLSPSEQEQELITRIYNQAGSSPPGVIEGQTACEILTSSVELSPIVLSAIWDIADERKDGYLSETGVAVALRLIGWAQSGEEVCRGLVSMPGPLAQFKMKPGSPNMASKLPPFTQNDRETFQKAFEECCPKYGLLDGEHAQEAFSQFDISPKDFWQIWNLADRQKRGALDKHEFALAMYFIRALLLGQLTSLPISTPAELLEQIITVYTASDNQRNSPPRSSLAPNFDGSTACLSPADAGAEAQDTSGVPSLSPSRSPKLLTDFVPYSKPSDSPTRPTKPTRKPPPGPAVPINGHSKPSSPILRSTNSTRKPPPPPLPKLSTATQEFIRSPPPINPLRPRKSPKPDLPQSPAVTSPSRNALSISKEAMDWGTEPQGKANADEQFDSLDLQNAGHIEGDLFTKFISNFQLLPEDLARVRYLADINKDNRITREGFAIALHFVEQQLFGAELELPPKLPLSLIPPTLRTSKSNTVSLRHVSTISPSTLKKPRMELRRRSSGPPIPPKPISPFFGNHHTDPVITTTLNNMRPVSPKDNHVPEQPSVNLDEHRALERENLFLSTKVEELSAQIDAQREVRVTNITLTRENKALTAKIQEMEQITSELLQANETNPMLEIIQQQNRDLTQRLKLLENAEEQRSELERRIDGIMQENRDLGARLREVREAAEVTATRAKEEADGLRRAVEVLEEENAGLRRRAGEMERTISSAGPGPDGVTNVRELELLMSDITRENEGLKEKLRQMQQSTTSLLLLSGNGHVEHDEMRRENQRLARQVEELEELTRQLQRSSEDNELQRVLRDVTHENDALKGSMREIRQEMERLQSSSSRVGPLQQEIGDLKAEIVSLRLQLSSVPTEDRSVPPPAYED